MTSDTENGVRLSQSATLLSLLSMVVNRIWGGGEVGRVGANGLLIES